MWRSRRLGLAVILGMAVAMLSGVPPAVHASSQVPIRISVSTRDAFFGCGPTLCFTATGTGTASHLGAVAVNGSAVITSFDTSGAQLTTTTIENYVITAANGDTLDLTNTATGVEDLTTGMVQVTGSWHITGGTGRFSGASGQGATTGTGLANNAAGTLDGTFTFAGSISSVGSLR